MLRSPNRHNSSIAASCIAGILMDGRGPGGIGAVLTRMGAWGGAAARGGAAGSCRDTPGPGGSHRRTASGPSPKQAVVAASAGRQLARRQRSDSESAPPLRLSRRLLVLAGEQGGWKLRRITTLLRRTRMVFARSQVRLDELAIELPGRM